MTKPTARLTAVAIRNAPPSKLQDGGGLVLDKADTGGKWIWRYRFAGASREMGLGTYPTVSLADARKARDRWALTLAGVLTPSARDAAKSRLRRPLWTRPTQP